MGIGNVVARALARPAIISFLRTPIDILHSGNRHERAGIRKTQQDRLLLLLFRFSCERIHVCFFFCSAISSFVAIPRHMDFYASSSSSSSWKIYSRSNRIDSGGGGDDVVCYRFAEA